MNNNPLEKLHDIIQPEAIGLWPPAPGWWFLFSLLTIAMAVAVIFAFKKYKSGSLRRLAISRLLVIENEYQDIKDDQKLIMEVSVLLKTLCLQKFKRSKVASLSGAKWVNFLSNVMPLNSMDKDRLAVFENAYYLPSYNFTSINDSKNLLLLAKKFVLSLSDPKLKITHPKKHHSHSEDLK